MINLQIALDEFIYRKKLQCLSSKSIENYSDFISMFIKYASNIDVSLLDIRQINLYIESLVNRDISQSTVATYIRHLKIFVRFLCDYYSLDIDYNKINVPKSPKKNPHIYTDNEIKLIFNTVGCSDWLSCRNSCAVALMLDSGLRQNEVCTLLKSNINYDDKIINVLGKGNKERMVPIGGFTLYFLDLYFSKCPYPGSKYIFLSRSGERLTNNSVKLFMSKLSKHLPFEFSSHKLRHNFATNYLVDQYYDKGSMDIYSLMTIMGHESIETTKRYLHLANQIVFSRNHISHIDKILKEIV